MTMTTMPTDFYFSPDYATARAKFLAACAIRELPVQSHAQTVTGPAGEPLFTDVARIGPMNARRLLVLTSGVHGPEMMAGSGCQTGYLLRGGASLPLPPDTAVLLIHAINPWGAAHLRRYTEHNVDLCRNYIDFDAPLPPGALYAPLHVHANVDPHDAGALAAADAALDRYRAEHGSPALYSALMAGQYQHPDGLGFGGTFKNWSRVTMERILAEHAAQAEHVTMIDYHTGLGSYSFGCVVALQQGEALARVRRVFGEWVVAPLTPDREEDFVPVTGHTTPGYEAILAHADVTALVLEYGTYAPDRMLEILLADHRHTLAKPEADHVSQPYRQAVLRFFYPEDTQWRRAVFERSQHLIDQALGDLGSRA